MIGLEIIALVAALTIGNIKYEVSDDFIMELILSGTYTGKYNPRLLFSSCLYGYMLTGLYYVFPGVSWYLVIQLLIGFFGYVCFARLISSKLSPSCAISVVLLVTSLTVGDIYILPQFTKTASMALTAGGLLFIHSIFYKNEKDSWLGGVTLILGLALRFPVLYTAAPFLFVYYLFLYNENSDKNYGRKNRLVKLTVMLLVIILFRTSGQLLNKSSVEYSQFTKWSAARSEFIDYDIPSYNSIKSSLDSVSITENDYEMLVNWEFADSSLLGYNQLDLINNAVKQYREDNRPSLYQIIRTLYHRRVVCYPCTFLCFILAIILVRWNPKAINIPIVSGVFLLIYFCYFAFVHRTVYRVEFSSLLHAALLIAACCRFSTVGNKTTSLFAFSLAVLLTVCQLRNFIRFDDYSRYSSKEYREMIIETYYDSWNYDSDKYQKTVKYGTIFQSFVSLAKENPESVYVMDFNTTIQTLYYNFDPLISCSIQFPPNLFYMGGVTAYHPDLNAYISEKGYKNITEMLLDNSVYYVCNDRADLMLNFMHEHVDENVTMQFVETVDGLDIYTFTR